MWSRSFLHHLCKQKGKGVAYVPPTHSTELEMFSAPTSLKECPATLHSLILLQQCEWKMDNRTLVLSLAVDSDISFLGPHREEKCSLCSSDVMVSDPWHMKSYPGQHILLTWVQTSCISITPLYITWVQSSTVKDTSLPCPSMEVHSCDKNWNCETYWEFFCGDKNWGWTS